MKPALKKGRYERIHKQLQQLLSKPGNNLSRMGTLIALLHHKMDHFFWTGFYLLEQDQLYAGPYQGPVACQFLENNDGVCWEAINTGNPVIVPDVHRYPGHITCDSRSNSEIVVPLKNKEGKIIGVLDVDSRDFNAFDETDQKGLERLLDLL